MLEQAESALDDGGMDELAAMLSDTPSEESNEGEAAPADESTDELETDEDANAEQDDDAETDETEEAKEPAHERKIKVAVKGEDGTETIEEVPESELVKGYQRQSDYTRKTQALVARENEAVQFLQTKHQEIRNQYLQQAEVQRAAIVGMAGLKSDSEMAQLASADPAAWVAENQRQQTIRNYLGQLEQQISGEKQQAEQEAEYRNNQVKAQMYQQAWQQLSKDGIDQAKLANIYEKANKLYGFTNEELGGVYDARMVRALKDAAAYRDLQSQRKQVTAKAQDAPRLPNKQTQSIEARKNKEVETRFKSGRANLRDLATMFN